MQQEGCVPNHHVSENQQAVMTIVGAADDVAFV